MSFKFLDCIFENAVAYNSNKTAAVIILIFQLRTLILFI